MIRRGNQSSPGTETPTKINNYHVQHVFTEDFKRWNWWLLQTTPSVTSCSKSRFKLLTLLSLPSLSPTRYRTFFRPRYKIGYKTVTELAWRCCPGFMGEGCHDSPTDQPGLLPQHPSPKLPPSQKLFPGPRVPPHPKIHQDQFPGPKKSYYGESLGSCLCFDFTHPGQFDKNQ